jgi:hypothetical protein
LWPFGARSAEAPVGRQWITVISTHRCLVWRTPQIKIRQPNKLLRSKPVRGQRLRRARQIESHRVSRNGLLPASGHQTKLPRSEAPTCKIIACTSSVQMTMFKAVSICAAVRRLKPSNWQSNSQIVTTWSYGNSINTSRPSGTRPNDRYSDLGHVRFLAELGACTPTEGHVGGNPAVQPFPAHPIAPTTSAPTPSWSMPALER